MQLDQPIPSTGGENPYDFILSGPTKPKRSILPTGSSPKQRAIVAIAGAVGGLIVFFIILALISSATKGNDGNIVKLAQTQTEIVRVSTEGAQKVRDPSVAAFVQNVNLSLTSDQQKTVSYLAKHGHKLNGKNLGLMESSKTDASLAEADQAGQYDNALLNTMEQSLKNYKTDLATDYKSAKGTQKELLKELYANANNLLANPPGQVSQ
ncbi:MAG: hypothetical protein ABI221_02530 [Candidatus Saccharimonadales bacterium]